MGGSLPQSASFDGQALLEQHLTRHEARHGHGSPTHINICQVASPSHSPPPRPNKPLFPLPDNDKSNSTRLPAPPARLPTTPPTPPAATAGNNSLSIPDAVTYSAFCFAGSATIWSSFDFSRIFDFAGLGCTNSPFLTERVGPRPIGPVTFPPTPLPSDIFAQQCPPGKRITGLTPYVTVDGVVAAMQVICEGPQGTSRPLALIHCLTCDHSPTPLLVR